MDRPENIYSAVAFDLHPKIKAIIDDLNKAGQVDLDGYGDPYLTGVDRVGPNTRIAIMRNGVHGNILINTRRRMEPRYSWNPDDGFVRPSSKAPLAPISSVRPERARKYTLESFRSILEAITHGK